MHSNKNLLLALVVLVSFSTKTTLSAEPSAARVSNAKWYYIKTKNFTIVSDTSKKNTVKLVQNLEKFRTFSKLFDNQNAATETRPVKIYVTDNDRNYKLLTSYSKNLKNTGGFFRDTLNGNYAVMRFRGSHSIATLFHEYTHYLMANSAGSNVPLWYNEGVAEFLGQLEFRKDNIVVYGKVDSSHLYQVNSAEWLDVETLFRMRVLDRKHREKTALFYSMSWLAFHYFKSNPELSNQLTHYVSLTQKGLDETDALKQSMDMTFKQLNKKLRLYARKRIFEYSEITLVDPFVESLLEVQKLERHDTAYQLAEFFLRSADDSVRAEKFFDESLKHDAEHVGSIAGKANIAMFRCDDDDCKEAKALIDAAKRLNSEDSFVRTISGHINIAMMYRETSPDVKSELRRYAVRDYNQAINNGGLNLEAIAAAASLYEKEGRWNKAKELREVVYYNARSNHSARISMIRAYLNNDELEPAKVIANTIRHNHHFSDEGIARFETWYQKAENLIKEKVLDTHH